jgi:long-chain acyl-CoA synthetase
MSDKVDFVRMPTNVHKASEMTDASLTAARSAELPAAIELALAQPTLCAAFQVTAVANATRPALRTHRDEAATLSWREYAARVRSVATGLAALAVAPGDTIALMMHNCSEFHIVDTAALHLGAECFAIYQTNPPEQILPLIENSDARIVVTEPAYLPTIMAVAAETDQIEVVIVAGHERSTANMTVAELEALSSDGFDFEARWRAVPPEAVASINYTSGTTGTPKAVEWTHEAIMFHVGLLPTLVPVRPGGRWVSHLPMALITERYLSHYASMAFGYTTVREARRTRRGAARARPAGGGCGRS